MKYEAKRRKTKHVKNIIIKENNTGRKRKDRLRE
jgi:hypothetical protein